MRKHMLFLATSLSLGSLAFAQTPPAPTPYQAPTKLEAIPANADALSEEAIKTSIANAGFKMVKGLEFDDGVWRAEARGGNDHWVDLVVGPVTGKVHLEDAPSALNAEEIQAALVAVGYEDISNVEFDDGLWSVDAEDARGLDVDLLVDPDNGSVVFERRD